MPGISLVVNFDYPLKNFVYFHRIGRTGRFGAEGLAITFVQPEEEKDIQQIPNIRIKRVESVKDLVEVSEEVLKQRVKKAKEENKLEEYGIVAINKRKAKVKWKESERHTKESLIGDWKDLDINEPINPDYKFFIENELRECICKSCQEMDERTKEEFDQFKKKVSELYNCTNCSKVIDCLIKSLNN